MTKQMPFTQEFEDEAVRLALTSGRTRRELAENLGVGLSTLTRWIGRRRDYAWTCNGFVPVTYPTMPPWLRMRAG